MENKKAMRMMLMSFLLDPNQKEGTTTAMALGVHGPGWYESVWEPLMIMNLIRSPHKNEAARGWKVTEAGLKFLEEEEND